MSGLEKLNNSVATNEAETSCDEASSKGSKTSVPGVELSEAWKDREDIDTGDADLVDDPDAMQNDSLVTLSKALRCSQAGAKVTARDGDWCKLR